MGRKPPKPEGIEPAPRRKLRRKSVAPQERDEQPRKVVSRASKKLLKDIPTIQEMGPVIITLLALGDQEAVILGAVYIDLALEQLLRSFFRPLTPEEYSRMFDGSSNAIVGSFSAKIRLSYALKLINFDTYSDMLIINDIRNAMAHSPLRLNFSTKEIVEDCHKLTVVRDTINEMKEQNPGWEPHFYYKSPKSIFCETIFQMYILLYSNVYTILRVAKYYPNWKP